MLNQNKYNYQEILRNKHETAKEMFDSDRSYKEIGEAVGRTSRTIILWKNKFGWERNTKQRYKEGYVKKRKYAKDKYEHDGWWVKKIASRLDIHITTAYRWRKKDQWKEN